MSDLYLGKRFLICCGTLIVLFIFGALWTPIFVFSQVLLIGLAAWFMIDIFMLFLRSNGLRVERTIGEKLSNGDENPVEWKIENLYTFPVHLNFQDELPVQFQDRSNGFSLNLAPGESKIRSQELVPVERGLYVFGAANAYVSRRYGLVQRRFKYPLYKEVPVYPSFLKLRKYELEAFGSNRRDPVKAFRAKLGSSLEYEQIKKYIQGDPERWINWKATARRSELMVNQYAEERSKDIYCVVDTSRYMLMPFEGMSLMDYAINATLALSHIALKAGDRVGTVTFGKKIKSSIRSAKGNAQLNRIMELLYTLTPEENDPDYQLLNAHLRRQVQHRSLLILFTNFEVMDDFERKIPELRMLNRYHHLVVVFFRNIEIETVTEEMPDSLKGMYLQAVAESLVMDKEMIVMRLRRMGVAVVLTRPHDISTRTIQAYLDMKQKGRI
jgi:uncharacterized protein (DUF58 family)